MLQAFSGTVNSAIKLPMQNTGKDNNAVTPSSSVGRKSSFTASYALYSANGGRPTPRRRETGESLAGSSTLASPGGGSRFFREEGLNAASPPSLARRRNELKENIFQPLDLDIPDDKAYEKQLDTSSPFANLLKRSTTGPMTAVPAHHPASPWGPTPLSATVSPMGTFGSFGLTTAGTDRSRNAASSVRDSRISQVLSRSALNDGQNQMRDRGSHPNLGRLTEMDDTATDDTRIGQEHSMDGSGSHGKLSAARTQQNAEQLSRQHLYGVPHTAQSVNAFVSQADRQSHQIMEGDPLSPTGTNPYQTQDNDGRTFSGLLGHAADDRDAREGIPADHIEGRSLEQSDPGNRSLGASIFAPQDRTFGERSTRLQNGAPKSNTGFAGLAGLGGMGNIQSWPAGVHGGPADKSQEADRSFGERTNHLAFEPVQPPQFGPSTGSGFFGTGNGFGTLPQNGKPGSILQNSTVPSYPPNDADLRDRSGVGHNPMYNSAQMGLSLTDEEIEWEMRSNRGFYDPGTQFHQPRDPFAGREPPLDRDRGFSAPDVGQGALQPESGILGSYNPQNLPQGPGSNLPTHQASNTADQSQPNLSAAMLQPHQKIMVMPDRMRWVYQDPSGKVQGPFTGLEMHDWYKAGFFTPELLVKKAEDTDYEPLGQMIRRIGNSREPFLVPQVGVPHDPVPGQESAAFAGTTLAASQQPAGGNSQPPFAGSFPSFGTTLTAEQQNALERRKQEEQFLMARQREYLVHQQVMQKQGPGYGPSGSSILQGRSSQKNLNHHASAHSLHSQPSFGSMTSPPLFQSQLTMQMHGGSAPGLFNMTPGTRPGPFPPSQLHHQESQDILADEGLSRLLARQNISSQMVSPFDSSQAQSRDYAHANQAAAVIAQRQQLAQEQARSSFSQHSGTFRHTTGVRNERLQEFNTLRGITDAQAMDPARTSIFMRSQQQYGLPQVGVDVPSTSEVMDPTASRSRLANSNGLEDGSSGSAAINPSRLFAEEFPNRAGMTEMPGPFPTAPQSSTPLPAPTPQKIRQPLSQALTDEAQMITQDASTESRTPMGSVAPWAKEVADASRGPSLREIQESETHRAALLAHAEETAARDRRQQELVRASQPTPPAPVPSLPDSSTWGKPAVAAAPGTPTSPSVWSKAQKRIPTNTGSSKSLTQIQKDEEDRAKRAVAAAAASKQAASATIPAGKRYSELASRGVSQLPSNASSAVWSTIGVGGRVKIATNASSSPVSVKGGATIPSNSSATKARPSGSRVASAAGASQSEAQTHFRKWAKTALKGLNNEING